MAAALRIEPEYYTYNDYKHWQGDWELIGGIPYAMAPSPMMNHQLLMLYLARSLDESLEACQECRVVVEMDYKIKEDTIVRPDIAVVCGQKEGAYITKRPELIIEIVSPKQAKRDEEIKFSLYEAEAIPYYILAYPHDKRAKIYKLTEQGYKKVGDFLDEKINLPIKGCQASLDFGKIFSRL
ncbi:MAG: Uma2 family endonuclease [Epsilonproteobacteria bacterium]|nr:Uma2 family endonuclease [Campylobacterota bacterium]NPA64498.1 Uma2 family endonuclease [Campylobacterota bacterium]